MSLLQDSDVNSDVFPSGDGASTQNEKTSSWARHATYGSMSKSPTIGAESESHQSEISHREGLEYPSGIPQPSGYKRCIGIFLTILSAMTFSFTALIGRILNHLNPFDLSAWTFLFMVPLGIIGLLYELYVKKNQVILDAIFRDDSRKQTICCLMVRVLTGVSALVLFYYAVKYITVADAIVIDASSPIFVYIMAFIFFGEKFGFFPLFTTVIAIAGVALITRPPILGGHNDFDRNMLIGVGLSTAAMICLTSTIILLKYLEKVHHAIITFCFSFFGAILCFFVAWISGVLSFPTELKEILTVVTSGVLFYVGQGFLTLALQYEYAGPVGLLRTTEVIFVFTWQFLFLGVTPDIYSVSGAILVMTGAILTITRRWISALPADNKLRTNCNILLY